MSDHFASWRTLLVCCLFAPTLAMADDAARILQAADAYRLAGADGMQVETEVVSLKNGQIDRERLYSVFLRENRKSLVVMRSVVEKGQKVLMLADDFWLIMPNSQRPLRITPTQKLVGDASTGDIATLTWAADYDGRIVGEEACDKPGQPAADTRCTHLSLTARHKGLSYARIELWTLLGSHQPVRAELYVSSDRMAKQARFRIERIDGRPQVSEMTLVDEIQTSRSTVVRYRSRTAKRAPDEWFNPMFLTRGDVTQ